MYICGTKHTVVVIVYHLDVDLLQACRDEFHRRLRVYHAWKSKNKRRTETAEQRAPTEIVQQGTTCIHTYVFVHTSKFYTAEERQALKQPAPPPPKRMSSLIRDDDDAQRYFRIPFVRPGQDKRRGWWYAHFDGQYIARQLELHPGKEPLLLLAGKDDLEMCELTLEETGLARKQGAEILDHEFELEWTKHGGVPYIRPVTRAIRK